jgi:hypothetical protein
VLSEIIVQVAIIDAKGIMRASNAGPQPAPPIDLSDREHFRAHLDSLDDRLFISKPVIGRVSGRWSVQLTRRFLNRDGKFGGVVVASLNPAHFTSFYNRIEFGSSTTVALLGKDGEVRSSGGASGGFELGQDLSNSAMFRRAQLIPNASVDDIDPASGKSRLVTFRHVHGHPLIVSVGLDHKEIFRSSRMEFWLNCLIGLFRYPLRGWRRQSFDARKLRRVALARLQTTTGGNARNGRTGSGENGSGLVSRRPRSAFHEKRFSSSHESLISLVRPGARMSISIACGTTPERDLPLGHVGR